MKYRRIFDKAQGPLKQGNSNKPESRSLGSRIQRLNSVELHAYYARISWPAKLQREPIKRSESYLNPNMTPNM